jgi:hypothetical protein
MLAWIKRRLRGWRTVAFGAAVALLGLLDALSALDITPLLPEGKAGSAMAVIGLVTIALRFVTTGPVGTADRRPEPDWEQG